MKLTIPVDASKISPTIPGVYWTHRINTGVRFWRVFDGENWYYGVIQHGAPSYEEALKQGKMWNDWRIDFHWQGLAQDPYETD